MLVAGCCQDEIAVDPVDQEAQISDQAVQISVGTGKVSTETRSVGSIGDVDATNNVWIQGHAVNIFALKKGEADLSKADNYFIGSTAGGEEATINAATTTSAVTLKSGIRYYPMAGSYSFYGYHVDDATLSNISASPTSWSADVKFEGSQDIMVGKAELSGTDKLSIVAKMITTNMLPGQTSDYLNNYGEYQVGVRDDDMAKIEAEYAKAYSAYTSRRDVQPDITFKHQLARLKFWVIAGDDNAQYTGQQTLPSGDKLNDGIFIQSVSTQALGVGKLSIDNANEAISFTIDPTATPHTMYLNERDASGVIQQLAEVAPKSKDKATATQVGESLLLPASDQYVFELKYKQYLNKTTSSGTTEYNAIVENGVKYPEKTLSGLTIKPKTGGFEAGKSYNIYLTIYGTQEIKIDVTITPWEDGGDIDLTPED